ncbi:cytochrome c biogenesis protein ResB [Hazenella coriacea]|uniref:Cytochrome c biogenesis protein n=1 Tax=Hazenella coriacea TaxID=1179467 RepID=A0A4R3L5L1_9BACL|nr:cytochrome c biogenesis protein ResB [Hazenella coriacea]TCS93444.1 cytochrome c biogenesis protein [Hazenella coriacea]
MIENTKCECGHNNPVGTVLCEYCGKPLDEAIKDKEKFENEMRYEGKARRSQVATSSLFDSIWNFFSSVKIAIIMILVTLVAAGIGTIFPQEEFIPSRTPEIYYAENYGIWGEIFYSLGFSDMYSSWWFFLLISMIGISLVVCSLDRVVPLYKALKNQRVIKNTDFIIRQRISHQESIQQELKSTTLEQLSKQLEKKRYKIRQDGDAILAEKGRISRWGPYINHIGLIIFLFALLLRYIPGWYLDDMVVIREGEMKKIPDTEYYVKNEKAFAEFYDPKEVPSSSKAKGAVVKKYQTDVSLYVQEPNGQFKQVHKGSTLVNHPVEYQGLSLFQSGMELNPKLGAMTLKVIDKQTNQDLGNFTVDLFDMKLNQAYQVNPDMEVKIEQYYPDFALENNQPITRSQEPNRPAFIFELIDKKKGKSERSWVISGLDLDKQMKDNQYAINFGGLKFVNESALQVRIDKRLPLVFTGGIISMIGLVMGFYWQHRRVWIRYTDGKIYIGAHTNKNWYSLRRELQQVTDQTDLKLKFVD